MKIKTTILATALIGGSSWLPSLLPTAMAASQGVAQQVTTCKGRVLDAQGEPAVGATVKVLGSNKGALTDAEGAFSIAGLKHGDQLQVSYVGFENTTVTWNGHDLTITLQEDNNSLDELVVVGYGTVRKADLAGSVAVLDGKNFKDQPVARISDALSGRVSGVQVQSSGVPGGSIKIRVRGINSVNKSNDPLYVVDGIVRESGLDGISPEDIQSIQILKDASSTAIYGARGANGVVLITTKTGRAGAAQITFDANVGFANAYHIPKVMSAQKYAQALVDYKGVDKSTMQPYLDGSNPGIDWVDEILHTGVTQDYKLAITKGNEDTQYYLSANYMNQSGVIRKTGYTRYSFKSNIRSKVNSWFEVTADVNMAQNKYSGAGGFGQYQGNSIWTALNYSPTIDMFTSNGAYHKDPYNNIQLNPLGVIESNRNDRTRNVANGRIDLKFNLLPGLTFTSTNGFDYNDWRTYGFTSLKSGETANTMGNASTYNLMLQSSNNLTYIGRWDKHALTATAVWEATKNTTKKLSISGRELNNEDVSYWNIKDASKRDADNNYIKWTMLSAVGRVIYSFNDTYMLTGTIRADGSSRFNHKKWGYFPSIAAAWTLTNEPFMQGVKKVMNDAKLRVSYGLIGNQDIDPYSTLGTLSTVSFNMGTATKHTGYIINSVPTPDLSWEKVHQFDLGLDMYFLQNRINVSLDYFHKKTIDALLKTNSGWYEGNYNYYINGGEVTNSGIDLAISARVVDNKNLTYTTTLNASYLKNKVTKLTAQEPIIYGKSPAKGSVDDATIIKEGEAIGTFYGYKWAGVEKDASGKFIDMYYNAKGEKVTDPTSADRVVLGKATPDVTLGWNNSVSFKNWEFNAFFNGAFGAKRLNLISYFMYSMPGASRFVTADDYMDRVGKDMASLDAAGNKVYGNSSKWIENADYFRLENLSVAYNLSRKVTKFADIRLSFSVQNLFTLSSYTGIDPAGSSFSDDAIDGNNGLDMGAYPTPRTFTFGARFTF